MQARTSAARIGRLLRDERGNVLALTAIALPLIIGCAGLAVDTTQWVLGKRQLQAAADAAAVAGVYGVIQSGDAETAVERSVSAEPGLASARSIEVQRSPEGRSDDPHAVRVRLTAPANMTFSSLFLGTRPTITAEATATVVETGEYCAFAIGSGDDTGLHIKAGSTLEMDCGIASNSSSADAITADGSTKLDVPSIVAAGGIRADDDLISGKARSYGLKQRDPLADTEPPLVPDTGCPNVTVNPDAASAGRGRVVLKPGCYGNLVLNGPVHLEPGEYILNRGSLLVGPLAELTCNDCSIFLTSREAATDPGSVGKVRIHHHAKVKLSAPDQGPNAGILIYQDRHAALDRDGFENVIAGNSFSELRGLIYLPSETVQIDGTSSPNLRCARFIGRRLIISGRVAIAKDCTSSGILTLAGTEVRLVS